MTNLIEYITPSDQRLVERSATFEAIDRYLRHCAGSDNPFRLVHETRKLRREVERIHDYAGVVALAQRILSITE